MEMIWKLLARVVSVPWIADALIKQAKKTEYFHLQGYMERWWLFNKYESEGPEELRHKRRFHWLPSVRIHHILREDLADDLHDHPWNARTIILKGWYEEEREDDIHIRIAGDTATLKYGEFHNIKEVSPGGVWTLFMTWDYQGTWGFLVDGVKVPWREYEDRHKRTG
jgi:hypothetical protein